VNWRLLPEDSVKLAGTREVTIEKGWDTVKEFVDDLSGALSEDERAIRETVLDQSGGFKKVQLQYATASLNEVEDVFVDTLGRIILPPEQKYQELQSVTFIGVNGGEAEPRDVVNMETRYEGNLVSDFVIYLEVQE